MPLSTRVLEEIAIEIRLNQSCGLNSRTLLTSEPLFGDPVVYITRTMDDGDAFRLTGCEEANDIQVDETDFVQVERDVRSSGLYLRF